MSAAYARAADGVRIAYRDEGPREAPVVLFCTMGTAAMSVWDPVATPLSVDWRLILHDRRGDGDSDPGDQPSHTFGTYTADALAVLDAAGCETAIVCGMAFGSRIAMRIARDAPQRTLGLALFDATGGPPAPEAERRAGSEAAAKLRAEAGLPPVIVDRAWFHKRDRGAVGFSANAFRNQPAWLEGLGAIRAPTLIACGEQDPNLPGSRRLATDIRGAQFRLMPMTGHASILERPHLVLDLLRTFLNTVRPT
jgi:pimeloyl-ACP methyl ester carboxylesterase